MCKFSDFNYTPQGCACQKRRQADKKPGLCQKKKNPAPKLVNTYFQQRCLLLIHIVTSPAHSELTLSKQEL